MSVVSPTVGEAFVANALGITCDSFDVCEGCMSWVRSLQIAYNFLAMQSYSNILIVNAEFNVYENGLPSIFGIRSSDQVKYTFPALTIGEAATATIVSKSSRHWQFRFRSAPAFHVSPLFPGFINHTKVDSLASVTGRVGYGWDRFLGYVKGGGAWERDKYDFSNGVIIGTLEDTRSGWTIGIGGEYAFTNFVTGFTSTITTTSITVISRSFRTTGGPSSTASMKPSTWSKLASISASAVGRAPRELL
jgi:hypothetical protein